MNRTIFILAFTILAAISGATLAAISGGLSPALQISSESGVIPVLVLVGAFITIRLFQTLAKKGLLNSKNQQLVLWALLISHRAFIQRGEAVNLQEFSMSSVFSEISVTLLIFGWATVLLAMRLMRTERFTVSGTKLYFLGYVSFTFVSILWTPSPTYAGFWLLRLISVAIILILYFEDVRSREINLFIGATLLGLLPIMGTPILYFLQGNPIYSDRIIAYWIHPGTISITAASVGTYAFVKLMQTSKLHWLALSVVSFLSVFLAGGKAGAAAVLPSLLLVLLVSTRLQLAARMVVCLALVAILIISNWDSLASMDVGLITHAQNYLDSGNFGTMLTRFDLWKGALQAWLSSLPTFLFGHGYTAARVSGINTLSGAWTTTHAHNSIITSLFELGLLGTVPLLIFILQTTMRALRHARHPSCEPLVPLLGGLFVLLIGSMTDDVFGGLLHTGFYIIIALIVSIDATLSLISSQTGNFTFRPQNNSSTYLLPAKGIRPCSPHINAYYPETEQNEARPA